MKETGAADRVAAFRAGGMSLRVIAAAEEMGLRASERCCCALGPPLGWLKSDDADARRYRLSAAAREP